MCVVVVVVLVPVGGGEGEGEGEEESNRPLAFANNDDDEEAEEEEDDEEDDKSDISKPPSIIGTDSRRLGVCVCVFTRAPPSLGSLRPLKRWRKMEEEEEGLTLLFVSIISSFSPS
jgi:hypothetical protein